MAMQAPPEQLAYVVLLNVGKNGKKDALGVIDLDPKSSAYGRLVGQVDFPGNDNELHHFGWNACSACLCPQAPHAHMERRYLIVPGISSSLDDRFLYVSCFGTGEFIQYDVSDPAHPKKTGSIHLGGIVRRSAHPKKPGQPLNGAPQMVEISRDGKRVYFTNSLYSPWDEQFYPDGVKSWMVKIDADPKGGMKLDEKFFVEFDGLRAHQVRLQGGDASSDSYCYSETQ
jgi:hypothetical protein